MLLRLGEAYRNLAPGRSMEGRMLLIISVELAHAYSRNDDYGMNTSPRFHELHSAEDVCYRCKSGKHLLVLSFSRFDPNVWSGRALQEVSSTWQMRSCINVS